MEIRPFGDEATILIKNLDAIILAICHIEATIRREGYGVRCVKLTRLDPRAAPLADESCLGIEFDDP